MMSDSKDSDADRLLRDDLAGVRGRLQNDSHRMLRCVTCDAESKTIVLRGTVPSYYLKQLAWEVARDGARCTIVNRIKVEIESTGHGAP